MHVLLPFFTRLSVTLFLCGSQSTSIQRAELDNKGSLILNTIPQMLKSCLSNIFQLNLHLKLYRINASIMTFNFHDYVG